MRDNMNIAFTGTRKLIENQNKIVWNKLNEINNINAVWHVGDACGIDAIVRLAAKRNNRQINVYEVENKQQRYAYAERSKRMIKALSQTRQPKLIAFANKNCPYGCSPCANPNGKGSGTWLTIAYARFFDIDIEIIFLEESLKLPQWMQEQQPKQLSLW